MAFLLHQLLTQSDERYPEKEALIDRDETITYRALDHLSDQVARTLRMHGVAKGDRVGIYLNKSIRSVVAIFGLLKAGGVYVPLDPSAPVRRVAFMIEDCSMKALVTTSERFAQLREVAPASSPGRCVPLVLHETIRGDSR
ncbi:MAG TPA: AMP-binding protein, partial [Candidatus Acidoferrum sp.]|nr:AMP-binding protein [Candidatus Acidoferrum sp.]